MIKIVITLVVFFLFELVDDFESFGQFSSTYQLDLKKTVNRAEMDSP